MIMNFQINVAQTAQMRKAKKDFPDPPYITQQKMTKLNLK